MTFVTSKKQSAGKKPKNDRNNQHQTTKRPIEGKGKKEKPQRKTAQKEKGSTQIK